VSLECRLEFRPLGGTGGLHGALEVSKGEGREVLMVIASTPSVVPRRERRGDCMVLPFPSHFFPVIRTRNAGYRDKSS
jgi:hypothetical protein